MNRKFFAFFAYAAAVAVLLGVFVLYTQPATMVRVSDMIWACFN